jgi:integrase/recombinase XerD
MQAAYIYDDVLHCASQFTGRKRQILTSERARRFNMALSTALSASPQRDDLAALLDQHLNWLHVKGYSDYTIRNRLVHIRFFLRWCTNRGIVAPGQITVRVLQDYQQHTFDYRKRNGEPLAVASRHARLVPVRVWLRWMSKADVVCSSLVEAIELPKLGRPLPRNILSAREVVRIMAQPNIRTVVGLRDRAILQLLYSTGIRRLELVRLKLADCQFDRRLVFVREGKGKRDRYVPLGRRAVYWLRRYYRHGRSQLLGRDSDSVCVFLSRGGQPLSRDHVTYIARKYIKSACLGKSGSCHLLRHSMATLMHENGADIRHVQQILGHADIRTTQIYAQVAIRTLQRVHAATHPAA